ncbi:putative membrane protein SpoIIM required for sporulation [Melghirimyces profundicolus]|uniref:Putative membrane protein SpoIIM required for sporulation n=1 Tax=Melghirimyces profundicolus TaxID=1242148 RepID=A0A2T6BGA0_9BACL|nr:stage II sporulation protein M [Melghirimyces profundicolus]PTX55093.1 putative membrane protein SpoIIM required for sporulation [Melghirimyces profundicolus]
MLTQSAHRWTHFIQKHQPEWDRLEELIRRCRSRRAGREELDELGHTYRRTAAHLAYAQTYFPDQPVVSYLNGLVGRAHQTIYATNAKGDLKEGLRFFTRRFPVLFHERAPFFLISLLLFAAGAGLSFGLTWVDPANANAFLPPGLAEVDPKGIQNGNQWDHAIVSGQIMTNNIRVAFLCFALGALLGVGTVWVLFMNGLLIGSLAALFHRAGEAYSFWAYIWPHGVIELAAIFIAGAAGLSLAYAFWVPGELTRLESFKREGKVTVQLVLGVIPMFIVAGLIEGFITPAPWPLWTKYGIALATLTALFLYFGRPAFVLVRRRSHAPLVR